MIKNITKLPLISLIVALSCFISAVSPVWAAKQEIIVILDLGKILSRSNAMADVDKQVKAMEQEFRSIGTSREKKLREELDELNRQRVILPPESFAQKKKVFSEKAQLFKKEMQTKLRQLALSRSAAINKIEKAMEPIVSQIANSVGATMIIEKKQILFAEKELDISDRIIVDLNNQLNSVSVKLVPLPAK